MKPETIYNRLLGNLTINGRTYERIMHPLFYTYPYALRFEIGDPELAQISDWERYARSAIDRAGKLYHSIFDLEDQVLVIIDKTPDRELKAAFSECSLQRIRSKSLSPFVDDIDEEDEIYFYRYLYSGSSVRIPAELILEKIVMGEVFGGEYPYYSSCVYFYNVTKSLLFHLYDDRGADLVGFCPDRLLPYYHGKQDMLLDWDRAQMARKLGIE